MPQHIPIELYAPIFQHITSKVSLSNLCTVSRAFRHEAQRVLYHTIRLSSDYDYITSWCHLMIEKPGLAVHVYALSLPVAFAAVQRQPFSVELNPRLQELQHVVKRALSSLSRLAELHVYRSPGILYLDFDTLYGHPFHLQVFVETLHSYCKFEHCLEFLSEQRGIRHWKSNVRSGHVLESDVLPSLTSANIYSSALNVLTRCPIIHALRINGWSSDVFRDDLAMLNVFKHKLTSLSIGCFDRLIMELKIVKDAVPNIKFLALASRHGASALVEAFSEFY